MCKDLPARRLLDFVTGKPTRKTRTSRKMKMKTKRNRKKTMRKMTTLSLV